MLALCLELNGFMHRVNCLWRSRWFHIVMFRCFTFRIRASSVDLSIVDILLLNANSLKSPALLPTLRMAFASRKGFHRLEKFTASYVNRRVSSSRTLGIFVESIECISLRRDQHVAREANIFGFDFRFDAVMFYDDVSRSEFSSDLSMRVWRYGKYSVHVD